MEGSHWKWHICILVGSALLTAAYGATDPGDLKVLVDFKNGMKNPEVLQWPDNGVDPCGPPSWPYVYCSGNRVTQIQAKNLNLKGHLPQNFNQLSELYNLGLMNNSLSGMLPTFKGLSKLEYAFLNDNQFDAIPSDFFSGLASLRVLGLGGNPLNASSGWSFPHDLANSTQLTDVSLVRCNLIGTLPDFLGTLPSLNALMLSYNRLSGGIPASFKQSTLKTLWLNNQDGVGMNGSIDAIASMQFLTKAWLHGNQFSGPIPETIGNLASLEELNLNKNQLVGMIPRSLANMELRSLVLNNNYFMGPIPKFKAANVSYDFNSFCQTKPGVQCAPEVTVLLDFLGDLNYPLSLVSKWSGNDPCAGPWFGLNCDPRSKVSVINLPGYQLNGTLSPSIAKLSSLLEIRLGGNNIHGRIPSNLTGLQLLRLLDLSGNNIEPPLPKFHDGVKLFTEGNPLVANRTENVPPSDTTPSKKSPSETPPSPFYNRSSSSITSSTYRVQKSSRNFTTVVLAGVATFAAVVLVVVSITICCCKKKNVSIKAPGSVVVHPAAPSNPESKITIAVSNDKEEEKSIQTTTTIDNISIGTQNSSVINDGNMVISAQVLREVTNNFAAENELGHGGFGTVYMGELEDGTKVAVKRMEGGAITSKGFDEFQSEIAVLSKVRHKHLVSLLGYSIEGNERLLAYEYMPQGALSKHLFHWKSLNLEPLSWTCRLTIALDVARGIEYLHSLACQTFIHRDLKSSNILLGDDFRAKVSDFGLVKLAPDGGKSVVTKLAGTFGYLAPEYAVMGKITTKADVFSYGVVLMELLTGRMALDESRPEETRYLAEWFWRIKSSRHQVMAAVDPVVDATAESISIIAELAGHCIAREPLHRPDMGHVVNVLAPLTEKWKPFDEESSFSGIDYSLGLPKMLKMWQDAGSRGVSYSSLEDSKESIPARPSGFAESFTSMDGR